MKRWLIVLVIVCAAGFAQGLITASFEDVPLKTVVALISKEAKINVVAVHPLEGVVSASFSGVSANVALSTVLQSKGYSLVQKDGIYKITRVVFRPSKVRTFVLQYASVEDVAQAIRQIVPGTKELLLVNAASNRILLPADFSRMNLVEDIISSMDVPPLQVMVEAKIFEVSAENSQKYGSKFLTAETVGDKTTQVNTDSLLPAEQSIKVLVQSDKGKLEAYLSALETQADFNMLSTPKVIAVNNQEAILQTTAEVAYQDETITYTTAGQVTSKKLIFKTIGTALKFKPHINDKGLISIDLYPEISTAVSSAEGYPLSQETKIRTQVVVRDGETFLIGGLLRDREESTLKKVPLLGDIPLLGNLFRRTEKSIVKKEVVIMVTPKIIK